MQSKRSRDIEKYTKDARSPKRFSGSYAGLEAIIDQE